MRRVTEGKATRGGLGKGSNPALVVCGMERENTRLGSKKKVLKINAKRGCHLFLGVLRYRDVVLYHQSFWRPAGILQQIYTVS